jgi:hypothetical protein
LSPIVGPSKAVDGWSPCCRGQRARVAPALDASRTPLTELALLPPFRARDRTACMRGDRRFSAAGVGISLLRPQGGPLDHRTHPHPPTDPGQTAKRWRFIRHGALAACERSARAPGRIDVGKLVSGDTAGGGRSFQAPAARNRFDLAQIDLGGAIPSWVGGCATQTACVPSLAAT